MKFTLDLSNICGPTLTNGEREALGSAAREAVSHVTATWPCAPPAVPAAPPPIPCAFHLPPDLGALELPRPSTAMLDVEAAIEAEREV